MLGSMFEAAFLGLVEGLTEFIPVSSTAHLLLASHFLGFESEQNTFQVVIQLGAILALLSVYFSRLWTVVRRLPFDADARRFVGSVLVAFLPAMIIGALLHDFIKGTLFHSPILICLTLILGGLVLLWVDRLPLRPVHTDAMRYPLPLALKIGLFQCLAMVPGVSRSGSTIVGSLLMGTDKRSAAEFSFFLALPTMAGAFAYDLYKNWHFLSKDGLILIVIGFVAAFVAALVVVKTVLDYVARNGFSVFGWWRIIVGSLGLAGLLVFR